MENIKGDLLVIVERVAQVYIKAVLILTKQCVLVNWALQTTSVCLFVNFILIADSV